MAKKQKAKPKVEGYGYCPDCGAAVVARERRPDGNDTCANGCTYPSRLSVPKSIKGKTNGKSTR